MFTIIDAVCSCVNRITEHGLGGEPEFEADSDLLKAPGTQTLRFEAVEAGQMDLKLVYHRPCETVVEPLVTFTVQVTIQ